MSEKPFYVLFYDLPSLFKTNSFLASFLATLGLHTKVLNCLRRIFILLLCFCVFYVWQSANPANGKALNLQNASLWRRKKRSLKGRTFQKKKNAKKKPRFVGLITWKLWLWPKKNRRLSKEIIQFCRCISCQQHECSESHTAAKAKDNKK